jgi:hypothetical protein
MGYLKLVERPFGKEILRELRIDRVVFYQEQFDHEWVLRLVSPSETAIWWGQNQEE